MKCNICRRKTNWDESYGYKEFIVCPCCHKSLLELFKGDWHPTMRLIFTLGEVAMENNPKKDEG